jgi:hypothetical protein
VLLSGWKDISAYLKCGIRTAQRWQRDLHLPVMRVRKSARGPVLAESRELDDWIKRRSLAVTQGRTSDLKMRTSDLKMRASDLKMRTTQQGRNFLWTEVATGKEFVKLALASTNNSARLRRCQAARRAYDTLERHLVWAGVLPQSELKRLREQIRELRSDLEKLGETFHGVSQAASPPRRMKNLA